MGLGVFVAVVVAALLHAAWNAMVKVGGDKWTGMGAVVLGHMPFAAAGAILAPLPASGSVRYIVMGIALHVGYQLLLLRSYEMADLTLVYPLARGTAPLMVAVASVTLMGVRLSGIESLAILIIGCGIIGLGAGHREWSDVNRRSAAGLAILTGCVIATYSLLDGTGARVAGTSLGFYSWLALGNGMVMGLLLAVRKPGALGRIARRGRTTALCGGGASFAAYSLVTWAFTQAPIALVTALREVSVLFALLIGVFALNERLDLMRMASIATTMVGATLLRLAGR